ncbi:thioredoxin-like protein [Chytridium lagenaria]|nr:thioredoxin-like protein [Chytridium lagenaria]
MSTSIEFFYDVVCPWAYLGSRKLEHLATLYPHITLIFTPVLLGGIYNLSKAPQGKHGSATDVMALNKKNAHVRDMARTVERSGVTLNWNTKHPVRSVNALRLLYALEQPERRMLTHALYQAYWVNNQDLSDPTVLLTIASSTIPAEKFSPPLSEALFSDPDLSKSLHDATSRIVDLGGPGVPCFRINETMYWGQDRLHFVESHIVGRPVPMPRMIPAAPIRHRKTLTFFWDVSSPWSYIAWMQTKRIQRDAGPLLTIEHVPILVGALFKEIGTANVPMLTLPQVKREYGAKDMREWTEYWSELPYEDGGKPGKVELNFPSVFPIRSVLPSRVILVDPDTTETIFKAGWQRDIEIADPEKLRRVLDEAGFDGGELLRLAEGEEVKRRLRENHGRAVGLGLCGVPTFVVDGEVVWGQDRINVVMDLLGKERGRRRRCDIRGSFFTLVRGRVEERGQRW